MIRQLLVHRLSRLRIKGKIIVCMNNYLLLMPYEVKEPRTYISFGITLGVMVTLVRPVNKLAPIVSRCHPSIKEIILLHAIRPSESIN